VRVRVVVITGTDTGVGKTVTTAALSRLALDDGLSVAVVKAAQTGVSADEPTDLETVSRLSGCLNLSELVRLEDPLAPDTAARRLGISLPKVQDLAQQVLSAAGPVDLVLLEGSGGVTVRLDTDGGTVVDLAAALTGAGASVAFVVVTRLTLGTLNHTELTVDALRRGRNDVCGLVIGAVPDELGLAEQCNLGELPRVTGLPVLGAIPDGAGAWPAARFRAGCRLWFDETPWPGRRQRQR
jgi:dethiobiotin synthetase